MRTILVGMANINTTAGAFKTNTDKVIQYAQDMAEAGCTIGVFPEQVISGYPVEDLVLWPGFVDGQWQELERFAQETGEFSTQPVFVIGLTVRKSGGLYNCAVVVYDGEVRGIVPKEKLPTYDVFYEGRTFSQGIPGRTSQVNGVPFGDLIFEFPFGTTAVEVCEDIWSPDGPIRRHSYSGAELVVNLSSSPFRAGILDTRREMVSTRAADDQVTLVYINQIGGQDSLVFDGGGFVSQNGQMLLDAPRWQERLSLQTVDLDRTLTRRHRNTTWRNDQTNFLRSNTATERVPVEEGPKALDGRAFPTPVSKTPFLPPETQPKSPREELFEDLLEAMQMGLAGFFEKTGVFERIGIALSGGKDSALSLIVAWLYAQKRFANLDEEKRQAAVRDFIHCFSMPSRFNSPETKSIAKEMCETLGVAFKELSIQDAFERETEAVKQMLGLDEEPTALTLQNIQARIRAERMWSWSNTAKGLWLQPGNMSEKAVGYTTVGGDLMGSYSLIGNLPKTVIIALLGYLAQKFSWPFFKDLLATKASAELAEKQEDEKDLMPYPVLDQCLYLFVGEKMTPVEVYRTVRSRWTNEELAAMYPGYQKGLLKTWVKKFVTSFFASIFKWVQSPQTVHLGSLELDRERALQLPVVANNEWLDLAAIDAEPD